MNVVQVITKGCDHVSGCECTEFREQGMAGMCACGHWIAWHMYEVPHGS